LFFSLRVATGEFIFRLNNLIADCGNRSNERLRVWLTSLLRIFNNISSRTNNISVIQRVWT